MTLFEDMVILIVEDNDDRFELIRKNLLITHVDSDVIQLKNGQDVLDFLFKTNVEACFEDMKRYILLLDISAPQMNGTEVLGKIKQDTKMKKIPVIILTETDDPHIVEECYNLGCSIYIVKPKEHQGLEETVQKVGSFLSVVATSLIQ